MRCTRSPRMWPQSPPHLLHSPPSPSTFNAHTPHWETVGGGRSVGADKADAKRACGGLREYTADCVCNTAQLTRRCCVRSGGRAASAVRAVWDGCPPHLGGGGSGGGLAGGELGAALAHLLHLHAELLVQVVRHQICTTPTRTAGNLNRSHTSGTQQQPVAHTSRLLGRNTTQ
eukprot:1193251-Prorocentrum_minimum.AAC.8